MQKPNYIGKIMPNRMYPGHISFPFLLKGLLLILIFCTLPGRKVKAQATLTDEADVPAFTFDEVPVRVMVEGYKLFYIDAIYGNNKLLFVNIEDLFNTLNIPCIAAQKGNNISGFIENENRPYSIDFDAKQINIGTKKINTKNGLLKEEGALYMETSLFSEAFGITLTFNYRALTILLKSDFELPLIKQLRIEKLRTNLSKIKGEIIADTVVKRDYHILKFGTVDWSAASYQTSNRLTNHNLSLGVGTELLYGEADVAVNYYSQYKFDNRQLYYIWRWVDNDQSIIKQAQVGRISNQTISFINSPIIGAVVRNTPTTIRKASGYYTISEVTEPNWSVELYINNVMVDFTKADASGLYQFKVPNVYGYTTLKLKFYGPLGEERTDERTMNVPYTVMPVGEFEYGLSGGIVQDSISSRFGRAAFNYGVNRILTIGGGIEYLSSIPNGPYIPFATATFQPFSKLTINAEYAYGVKTRFLVNYYLKKGLLLEIDYARFVEEQRATLFNAPEERKVKLLIPIRYNKINGFAKLDYTEFVYKTFNYNQSSMMFSAYYQQFSANSSTQVNWIGNLSSYVINDFALSYRMKKGVTVRPSAQYNFSDGNLVTCKLALEKYIRRGNISFSYERNVLYNDSFIQLNFKYDLPFARTNISVSQSRGNIVASESAQGSLAFGGGNGYVYGSSNSSVGKGGILLYPFLDQNQNGIFDAGERMAKLATVSIMGGKVIISKKDSILRIPDLNAFTNYLVEFKDNDLENIAWRFKKKVYQVLIDPNQFKRIDIPIISVGEVSGMAYLDKGNTLKGFRRISVKFYEKNSNKVVAETLSESDGYIYYMGLEPGEYIARIDPEQLNNLEMVSSPEQIPVNISASFDGDIISGMDFTLSLTHDQEPEPGNIIKQFEPVKVDSFPRNVAQIPQAIAQIPQNVVQKPQAIAEKKSPVLINCKASIIDFEGNVIQIGAFKIKSNAFALHKKLEEITEKPAIVVYEDGYYKVRFSGFANRDLALQFASKMSESGFQTSYIPYIKPNSSIEVGEYEKEKDALKAQKDWIERTEKPVIILYENSLYKVRIPGFSTRNAARNFAIGMETNIFKLNIKNDDQPYSAVIQVGAFVSQENAIAAEQKLVKTTKHIITIIIEDGYYKVQIRGFAGRNQAIAFIPGLFDLGFSEAFVVRVKRPLMKVN